MRLVLIRHGATDWSVERRMTSRTDIDLNTSGEAEARALRDPVRRLLSENTRVVSSPSLRVLKTARAALPDGMAIDTRDQLAECNFGAFEGLTDPEISKQHPGWRFWRSGCPDGEPLQSMYRRCDLLAAEILASSTDIMIVSHGVFLRGLTVTLLGLPPEAGENLQLDSASLSVLDIESIVILKLWNWTCAALSLSLP
jgi:broad specificity phosphatase PhoE